MNDAIFEFFGFNQTWKTITDILLIGVLALVAVLAVCGLVQLIKRRSLKAVDAELTAMIPSLALVAVIYYVFEKVWILNYRPVLVNGLAEPSFPSTHALITTTVLGMLVFALPKYIKSRKLRVLIDVALIAVILVMAFGRVASGMHWATDALAGVIFGFDLALVYGGVLKMMKERRVE